MAQPKIDPVTGEPIKPLSPWVGAGGQVNPYIPPGGNIPFPIETPAPYVPPSTSPYQGGPSGVGLNPTPAPSGPPIPTPTGTAPPTPPIPAVPGVPSSSSLPPKNPPSWINLMPLYFPSGSVPLPGAQNAPGPNTSTATSPSALPSTPTSTGQAPQVTDQHLIDLLTEGGAWNAQTTPTGGGGGSAPSGGDGGGGGGEPAPPPATTVPPMPTPPPIEQTIAELMNQISALSSADPFWEMTPDLQWIIMASGLGEAITQLLRMLGFEPEGDMGPGAFYRDWKKPKRFQMTPQISTYLGTLDSGARMALYTILYRVLGIGNAPVPPTAPAAAPPVPTPPPPVEPPPVEPPPPEPVP